MDDFVLPEEMEPLEIIDRLKETIRKGREICREEVRIEMQDKGYNKVFPSLLEQASDLVYKNLKKICRKENKNIRKRSRNVEIGNLAFMLLHCSSQFLLSNFKFQAVNGYLFFLNKRQPSISGELLRTTIHGNCRLLNLIARQP